MNTETFFDLVEKNDLSAVKELINAHWDISRMNKYGYSALHIASFKGLEEMGILLAENGVDLNAQDKNGQTALHYVALNNQLDLAKVLLNKGADLSVEDIHGNQPLWTAVFNDKGRNDRIEMVKLFLLHGANKDHKNKVSKSPIDIINIAGYNNLKAVM